MMKIITYLDERLRVEEESDYLNRIKTHPDKYTETAFFEKIAEITLFNNGDNPASPRNFLNLPEIWRK